MTAVSRTPWQGKSGRWFRENDDGRVVPMKAPDGSNPARRWPNCKRDRQTLDGLLASIKEILESDDAEDQIDCIYDLIEQYDEENVPLSLGDLSPMPREAWQAELLRRALLETDDVSEAMLAADMAFSIQPMPDIDAMLAWHPHKTRSGKPAWKSDVAPYPIRYQEKMPVSRKPKVEEPGAAPKAPKEKPQTRTRKPKAEKPPARTLEEAEALVNEFRKGPVTEQSALDLAKLLNSMKVKEIQALKGKLFPEGLKGVYGAKARQAVKLAEAILKQVGVEPVAEEAPAVTAETSAPGPVETPKPAAELPKKGHAEDRLGRSGLRAINDFEKFDRPLAERISSLAGLDTQILDPIYNARLFERAGITNPNNELLRRVHGAAEEWNKGIKAEGDLQRLDKRTAQLQSNLDNMVAGLSKLHEMGVIVKDFSGEPIDLEAAAEVYRRYGGRAIEELREGAGLFEAEEPGGKPSEVPQEEIASNTPEEDAEMLSDAVNELRGEVGDLVPLSALQKRLGVDLPTLHRLVAEGIAAGTMYGTPLEGDRADRPEDRAAALDAGGGRVIGYVSMKAAEAPPAAPAAPSAASKEPGIDELQQIAESTMSGGWGDNKVFIHHVYEEAKKRHPELTPERFKELAVEANQQGKLRLSRADLVQAMHPEDVASSNIRQEVGGGAGANWNFIDVKPHPERQKARRPDPERASPVPPAGETPRQKKVREGLAQPHEKTLAEHRKTMDYDRASQREKKAIDADWNKRLTEAQAAGLDIDPEVAASAAPAATTATPPEAPKAAEASPGTAAESPASRLELEDQVYQAADSGDLAARKQVLEHSKPNLHQRLVNNLFALGVRDSKQQDEIIDQVYQRMELNLASARRGRLSFEQYLPKAATKAAEAILQERAKSPAAPAAPVAQTTPPEAPKAAEAGPGAAAAPHKTTPSAKVSEAAAAPDKNFEIRKMMLEDEDTQATIRKRVLKALGRGANPGDVDDVIQNVNSKLLTASGYDPEQPFENFLSVVAQREGVNFFRDKQKRGAESISSAGEEGASNEPADPRQRHPEDIAEVRDSIREMKRHIDALPPRQKRIAEVLQLEEVNAEPAEAFRHMQEEDRHAGRTPIARATFYRDYEKALEAIRRASGIHE